VSAVLDELRRLHDDRERMAREWHADGGKVVAYLCDNFPEELVTAAGMLPFRLRGRAGPAPNVVRHVTPGRASENDIPAFVEQMLEPVLAGDYEFLRYLVVPHGRRSIESVYATLAGARSHLPAIGGLELFYLDKSHVPGFSSSVFDRNCVLELAGWLERWSGAVISEQTLAEAIEEANRGRALLARLNEARIADPPRLSGTDALRVYALASAMPRADHNHVVEELLDRLPELPPRPGPRVYVAGSPHYGLDVYDLVESLGATVVAEDHCWGGRAAELPVPTDLPPLEAIAERYHAKPVCSIEFPLQSALQRWHDAVRSARPDAVLLYVLAGDELHVWDTPDRAALAEGDRIPTLHLPRRRAVDPETRDQLADWLAELGA
jgi:benzoyl-CoA reductase/2-hydroxyglutaryl-CoA dehydratase subunit BcrC/BadD/HgdB